MCRSSRAATAARPARAPARAAALAALLAALLPLAAACRQDMHDQPRIEPLERSAFFADGRGSRHPPEGTVAVGSLAGEPHLRSGRDERGELFAEVPLPLSEELLLRGQQRFDIFCSPCHGRTGNGDGMVSRRGFPAPVPLHTARLRRLPAGLFFDVISNGFGQMPSYGEEIPPEDRWAIVAWVSVLQLAAHAPADALAPDDLAALAAAKAAGETGVPEDGR